MRILVIDGTPTEIESSPLLRQMLTSERAAPTGDRIPVGGALSGELGVEPVSQSEATEGDYGDHSPVPLELVKRALTRIRPQASQKAFLTPIYRASDWISIDQILAQSKIKEREVGGIVGGIGLRLSKTRGWKKQWGRPFFAVAQREKRDGVLFYRLKPVFREALEQTRYLA